MIYHLETERLRFRNMLPEDAEAMFLLNSDPDVVKYTGDGPFESVAATREFLEKYQDVYTNFGYGRWIVELKTTVRRTPVGEARSKRTPSERHGEIIGWCGLKFHSDKNITDVGYRLYKKDWGKGYATEAAMACIEYGFSKLNLNSIIAHARKENIASVNVLHKCGMKIIGEEIDCGGEIFVFEIIRNSKI